MTIVERLLDTMTRRGLSIKFGDDGVPRVVGPSAEKTPALMDALRAFRKEVIVQLGGDPNAKPKPESPPAPKEDDWLPATMNDSELPNDSPDGLCYLVRAGDGTIKAVPMSWLDNQVRLAMEMRP